MHPEPQATPPPSGARWLRIDRVLLLIVIGVLLWMLGNVLLIVFAGILVAVALDGFAYLLASVTRLRRGWALVVVVVVVALLTVAGASTVVPPLVEQIGQLLESLPVLADHATALLAEHVGISFDISANAGAQTGIVSEVARQIPPASAAALNVVISALIVVAIGLFVAINPDLYKRGLLLLLPVHRRARVDEVLTASGHALRWWFVGQACSMAILGTVTSVTLWLLDVPLWLGLGLLTALFTFIPYFGPLIASVPVLLISFSQGVETGLTVLVIYVVLQSVEGFFMTPAIQQRAVRIPPALLISMQVAMGVMFGVPGLIFAAPLTPCLIVVVKLLYIEDVLGEPRA